jgi:hypothetical protein
MAWSGVVQNLYFANTVANYRLVIQLWGFLIHSHEIVEPISNSHNPFCSCSLPTHVPISLTYTALVAGSLRLMQFLWRELYAVVSYCEDILSKLMEGQGGGMDGKRKMPTKISSVVVMTTVWGGCKELHFLPPNHSAMSYSNFSPHLAFPRGCLLRRVFWNNQRRQGRLAERWKC